MAFSISPMLSAMNAMPLARALLAPRSCDSSPTVWVTALRSCTMARSTVSGSWLNSASITPAWLSSAATIASTLTLPSLTCLRSSPMPMPIPSARAFARRGAFSTTELNSSARSVPPARAWENCVMVLDAATALAPETAKV